MHVPHHRALPPLGSRVRRALVRASALTLGLSAVVIAGAGMATEDSASDHDFDVDVAPSSAVGKLIADYDCSTIGFDDGSTPEGAIVRKASGELAVVTFHRGWQVHVADGAAQLVAVCLQPPR